MPRSRTRREQSFSALALSSGPSSVADDDQRNADAGGDDQEQQDREIFGQHTHLRAGEGASAVAPARDRHDDGNKIIRPRWGTSLARPTDRWCPREDSNLHGFRRYHLKVVRLPIPPPGLIFSVLPVSAFRLGRFRLARAGSPPACRSAGVAAGLSPDAAGAAVGCGTSPSAGGAVAGAAFGAAVRRRTSRQDRRPDAGLRPGGRDRCP